MALQSWLELAACGHLQAYILYHPARFLVWVCRDDNQNLGRLYRLSPLKQSFIRKKQKQIQCLLPELVLVVVEEILTLSTLPTAEDDTLVRLGVAVVLSFGVSITTSLSVWSTS